MRKGVQILWALLSNGNLKGFFKGRIYQGPLKHFCVPGMNCYSCPGALGSCPIGAMQAVADGKKRRFPFHVAGYLAAIGLLAGRFVCGWLCPFGLIQELLHKIPLRKLKIREKEDRMLRYLKYVFLTVFVFALPFFYRNEAGMGIPFFCRYVCPVGTLEGGVPLLLANKGLRNAAGALFGWKMFLLILCVIASMMIFRPFCKYICPLGAFYSLFQRISLLRLSLDEDACVNCGECAKVCGMNVDPVRHQNSAECIRCGECVKVCPKAALSFQRIKKDMNEKHVNEEMI